jgi:hypothetical protein
LCSSAAQVKFDLEELITMKICTVGVAILATFAGLNAATIDFSTSNTSAWEVDVPSIGIANATARSGYTAGDVTPFAGAGNGSSSGYDGFWVGLYTFALPSNATGISLDFSGLNADDRAVLELNGNIIGDAGGAAPGMGSMVFTDGGPNNTFVFAGASAESGIVTTGFNPGATNTLEIVVNNTQGGIFGSPTVLGFTEAGVTGTVTYSTSAGVTSTPEPQSWFVVGAFFVVTAMFAKRRRTV